ncbi:hypothetical protein JZ751_025295 [Albula glossodonta]|uniref:Uncharacterized protein n=1 Tax=Albula glossodonta TaxID=121402 RepID=A0A8T2NES3_9TELE|nr:hypothetical protein JZ751_025295 [Albula glossodonta]
MHACPSMTQELWAIKERNQTPPQVCHCLSVTLATLEQQSGEELSPGSIMSALAPGSAPSPQSEAVTNELQELSLQSGPSLLPLQERKNESGKNRVWGRITGPLYVKLRTSRPDPTYGCDGCMELAQGPGEEDKAFSDGGYVIRCHNNRVKALSLPAAQKPHSLNSS